MTDEGGRALPKARSESLAKTSGPCSFWALLAGCALVTAVRVAASSAVGVAAKSRSAALNDIVWSAVVRGAGVGARGESATGAGSTRCDAVVGPGADLPDCGIFFMRTDSIVASRTTAATITMTNNN